MCDKMEKKETSCIRDGEKEFARNLFETKQKSLEEELEREKDFYEKFGLYSNRDAEDIEEDLKKVKAIVSNIDNLPKCKREVDGERAMPLKNLPIQQ